MRNSSSRNLIWLLLVLALAAVTMTVSSTEPLLDFLESEYPRVRFEPHPVLNGFFATGSKRDLLLIKEEVDRLNSHSESP